jgi:hypothetical protein
MLLWIYGIHIKYPINVKECNYLPICLGGCIRECVQNKTPSCPQDLMYYKDVLINYYENWKKKQIIDIDKVI